MATRTLCNVICTVYEELPVTLHNFMWPVHSGWKLPGFGRGKGAVVFFFLGGGGAGCWRQGLPLPTFGRDGKL